LLSAARADETPRETLQAAIKAHGGEENIAKTLTGTLLAKGKMSLAPDVEVSFSWEETFDLPLRYHRSIKCQLMGKDFTMEYAVTNGSGWIRQNGGDPKEFKGEKVPLSRNWNALLANLPSCLADGVKLEPGGKEKVEGRETVGVSASGEALGGKAVLFFDSRTHLLTKSEKPMQHPLSRKEVDAEVLFSDYKEISGVQYPQRIATYIDGKRVIEIEIIRIEFLEKTEDRLFEKP
jgi:hypothetical protein